MARTIGAIVVCGVVALAVFRGNEPNSDTPAVPQPAPATAPFAAGGSTSYYAAAEAPAPASTPVVQLASLDIRAAPAPARPLEVAPVLEALTLSVKDTSVHLRKSASAKAVKVAVARRGEAAIERARSGLWRELEFADGRRGWALSANLASPADIATPPKTEPAKIAPASRSPLPAVEPPSVDTAAAALAMAALIVEESRASYGGSCGCPEDRDRAGRRCGGRSAYSRAGGRSLFCYAEDVPAALVSKRMSRR